MENLIPYVYIFLTFFMPLIVMLVAFIAGTIFLGIFLKRFIVSLIPNQPKQKKIRKMGLYSLLCLIAYLLALWSWGFMIEKLNIQ